MPRTVGGEQRRRRELGQAAGASGGALPELRKEESMPADGAQPQLTHGRPPRTLMWRTEARAEPEHCTR
jgi:hypothetical protein